MDNLSDFEYEYDVFISHANEDKDTFVRYLAAKLSELGLKVWYDEFTLSVGDNLSSSIDYGLSKSKYGIVVLSHAFFRKAWPTYELRGLLSRQINDKKVILPIWHGIKRDDVLKYSPPLADALAAKSDLGVATVAMQLLKVIRPETFRYLGAKRRFEEVSKDAKLEWIPMDNLIIGPRMREKLTDGQMIRLRLIKALLGELEPTPFDNAYDDYLRELYVENELEIWERSVLIMLYYRSSKAGCSPREALKVLWFFLMGSDLDIQKVIKNKNYRKKAEKKVGIDLMLALSIYAEILTHPKVGDDNLVGKTGYESSTPKKDGHVLTKIIDKEEWDKNSNFEE